MNNRFFAFLCALCGALVVAAWMQRMEIIALKLVLWQIAENGNAEDELEEMF